MSAQHLAGLPPVSALPPEAARRSELLAAVPLVRSASPAELLARRTVQEDVLPALQAETTDEMWSRFLSVALRFERRTLAVSELLAGTGADPVAAQESLLEDAEAYGGPRWREAIEDGWRSIAWADAVVRELDPIRMFGRPREEEALGVFWTRSIMWGWSLAAVAAIVRGQASPLPEIQEFVLGVLTQAAAEAHAVVRRVKLDREASAEQLGMDFRPATSDDEERALEAEAHDEGERLLAEADL